MNFRIFKRKKPIEYNKMEEKELTLLSEEMPTKRIPLLTRVYNHKDLKARAFTGFLAGLLLAFALKYFVKEAEIYTGGVTGIAQGISALIYKSTASEKLYNIIYWGMYASLNIPLIIFGFFKVGKRFTAITLVVVISTSLWGFAFDNIPQVKDFHFFDIPNISTSMEKIYYTILSSIFYPIGIAFAFLSGASSGGTDFIVTYYSVKKAKPIGGIMFYVSFFTIIISVIIGDLIGNGVAKNNSNWDIRNLLSEGFILSISAMFLVTTIVDKLFPKQRKIEFSIVTKNPSKIINLLKEKGYLHTLTSESVVGVYTNQTKTRLTTVCSFLEKEWLIRTIIIADEKAFITVKPVYKIVGLFRVKRVD